MMKNSLAIVLLLFIYSSAAWTTEETSLEILDTCLTERKAMQGDPVGSVRYGLWKHTVVPAIQQAFPCKKT
jgi:hypothetical protein